MIGIKTNLFHDLTKQLFLIVRKIEKHISLLKNKNDKISPYRTYVFIINSGPHPTYYIIYVLK